MKKIIVPVLGLVLSMGCRSVAEGVIVPFAVRSHYKIPAKKIKLENKNEKNIFENEIVSFYPISNTVFKKCRIYCVATPPHVRKTPFCIAVPNESSVALLLTGNMMLINEIIRNEDFKLNNMEKTQIQKLLEDVFYFNQRWNMRIIDSGDDLKYNTDSEEDTRRKAEFEKRLAEEIRPISILIKGNKGFVEYYFISYHNIVKRILVLNQDCTIVPGSVKDEVVGRGIAPYSRNYL